MQRVLAAYTGAPGAVSTSTTFPPLLQVNQTTDGKARLNIVLKLVVSLAFTSFSTCSFCF